MDNVDGYATHTDASVNASAADAADSKTGHQSRRLWTHMVFLAEVQMFVPAHLSSAVAGINCDAVAVTVINEGLMKS